MLGCCGVLVCTGKRRSGDQGVGAGGDDEGLDDGAPLSDLHSSSSSSSSSTAPLSPLQRACVLPTSLRRRLLSDWQWVTRRRHIATLPRHPSVRDALAQFLSSLSSSAPVAVDVAREVCAGVLIYFERCVGPLLLYRIERPQHHTVQTQKEESGAKEHKGREEGEGGGKRSRSFSRVRSTPAAAEPRSEAADESSLSHEVAMALLDPVHPTRPSSPSLSSHFAAVYGCEHLLRLLVKLPALMESSDLLTGAVADVSATLQALIKWMALHESTLFPSTSTAYHFVDKHYLQQLQPNDCKLEPEHGDQEQEQHDSSMG